MEQKGKKMYESLNMLYRRFIKEKMWTNFNWLIVIVKLDIENQCATSWLFPIKGNGSSEVPYTDQK